MYYSCRYNLCICCEHFYTAAIDLMHTVESVYSMPHAVMVYPCVPCMYNVCIGQAEDRMFFRKLSLDCLVLDEGHMLKNMNSLRYTHLMKIQVYMLTNIVCFCVYQRL